MLRGGDGGVRCSGLTLCHYALAIQNDVNDRRLGYKSACAKAACSSAQEDKR